ncbi:MAG: pseudouridine-5'-phosphate glycosidase [Gemmatimonas sp.]|jgi:pseudouridine-5'-phosphate glycosidase|nr:pseudouridine-5'-phosphate glycosidase [Gemmatimonas sp.]MCA2989175.1 pseudouridine-5'-phosphate glycosidase [Gemmatimonas sp.]MCA2995836.1 pseudouridine-5'-phosphate glycosidase [Gemmatimonas sp.]
MASVSQRPLRPRRTASITAALERGGAVVALESSVLAQGLLPPFNREAAARMMRAVEQSGATPAITAIVRGEPSLGLEAADLERFLARDGVRKVSARDLGIAMADGADGATTVAATLALCQLCDIELFATGGIGGVHREAPFDESADLVELARSPVIVVCAGAKSILDLPATLERLETLGVPVVGYGTDELPGFFSVTTGLRLAARLDTPAAIARAWRAHRALGRSSAMLVVQPPPAEHALPEAVVAQATAQALAAAREAGVRGAAVTPFLLARIQQLTNGRSVHANLALLEHNARLAGQIAVALLALSSTSAGSPRAEP